jgi:midasin
MLLAERLRIDEEKDVVRSVIEKELKVTINMAEVYYGEKSEGRHLLEHVLPHTTSLSASGLAVNSIAPTQSMMRLLTLVMRCVKQKEPVLLVGDTGCGKVSAQDMYHHHA